MKLLIPVTIFPESGQPDMYAMPEWLPGSSEDARPHYLKVGFHRGTRIIHPSAVCLSVQHLEERFATDYMNRLLGRTFSLA
jgi:hypothetical protein